MRARHVALQQGATVPLDCRHQYGTHDLVLAIARYLPPDPSRRRYEVPVYTAERPGGELTVHTMTSVVAPVDICVTSLYKGERSA